MLIIYEPFAHGNSSLSSRAKVQIWLKVVTSQERKAEERVRKGPATESVVQRKGQMEVRGTPRSSTVSRGWRQSSLGEESMGGPGVTHQPSLQPPAPGEFESASSFLCQVSTRSILSFQQFSRIVGGHLAMQLDHASQPSLQ